MKLTEMLAAVLVPRCCHLCATPLLPTEKCVCGKCLASLTLSGFSNIPHNGVEKRLEGLVDFQRASAVYVYERGNDLSRLVHDFKYHGYPSLARELGFRMADSLAYTDFFTDIDAVTYVPLHWTRLLTRGYNQAQMLAEGVSRRLGLPVVPTLSSRWHVSQTRRTLQQRSGNAQGKYKALPSVSTLPYRHILLIDDVCTTGSTLVAALTALYTRTSALRVSVLTLGATV